MVFDFAPGSLKQSPEMTAAGTNAVVCVRDGSALAEDGQRHAREQRATGFSADGNASGNTQKPPLHRRQPHGHQSPFGNPRRVARCLEKGIAVEPLRHTLPPHTRMSLEKHFPARAGALEQTSTKRSG